VSGLCFELVRVLGGESGSRKRSGQKEAPERESPERKVRCRGRSSGTGFFGSGGVVSGLCFELVRVIGGKVYTRSDHM
jgi:hypothetical protein